MALTTRYKENWAETQARFERWWRREATDRPLLRVSAPRERPLSSRPAPAEKGPPEKWLDTDYLVALYRHGFETTWYGAETLPLASANLGPGSLAVYLGSAPVFAPSTIWYEPCISSLEQTPLPVFDPENAWFRRHLALIRALRTAFAEDACVAIPDIIESLDIFAAMRDPMKTLYDLIDQPAQCHRWLQRINALYAPHYDAFYDIVKDSNGGSVFTAFNIWAPGKVCKVQCDFCAMISPDQFAEFYVPYVREQIKGFDRVLYHLDGPEAIRHVDQLLAIEDLDAIQWVSGAGKADNGDPVWYPLYEKILDGGKSLQVWMPAARLEPFLRRFGGRGIYLLTAARTEPEAREIVALTARLCAAKG